MPWNLVLLHLLGGFIFLDWCYYSRIRHQRIDGNRLLLESAFTAAFLSVAAAGYVSFCKPHPRLIPLLLGWRYGIGLLSLAIGLMLGWYFCVHLWRQTPSLLWRPAKLAFAVLVVPLVIGLSLWLISARNVVDAIGTLWGEIAPISGSGTAAVTLVLGCSLALVVNFFTDYYGAATWAAEQAGEYLMSLSFQAVRDKKFITLFLSNRTALMGYVKLSPTLKKEGHIAIIVAAQGYLDDFRQLAWKARYEDEWRRDPRQAERFLVVIPTETIENAHIFNPSLDDESATVRL